MLTKLQSCVRKDKEFSMNTDGFTKRQRKLGGIAMNGIMKDLELLHQKQRKS